MRHQNTSFSPRTATAFMLAAILVLGAWTTLANAQTASTTATSTSGAPSCSLTANPATISPGQSATLSWTSTGANTGSLDQSLGSVASVASGSMTVQPSVSTTYTGTFGGVNGTTNCSTTVTVSGTTGSSASTTGSIVPTSSYYYGMNTSTSSPSPATGTYYGPSGTGVSTTVTGTTSTGSATAGTVPSLSTLVSYPSPGSTPAEMVLRVDSAGNVLIRGTVQTVSPTMMTIASWGGLWIVRSSATATVIPAGASGDLSRISIGDFVGVNGTLARDQIYTIDASLVRDWTTNPYTGTSATSAGGTSASPAATSTGSSSSASGETLYTGTASGVGDNSFTLTDSAGNSYTITTTSATIVWNAQRDPISLSQVSTGDSIRLNGTLDSSTNTITASVIRDTSISPATGAATSSMENTGTSSPGGAATSSGSDSVIPGF